MVQLGKENNFHFLPLALKLGMAPLLLDVSCELTLAREGVIQPPLRFSEMAAEPLVA